MKVEIVFDGDCPNVAAARESVRKALTQAGLPPTWKEWERTSNETPKELRGFGSPSVFVNGVDVVGALPSSSACCRIYRAADGRAFGAPSIEMVNRALREAKGGKSMGEVKHENKKNSRVLAGVLLLGVVAVVGGWLLTHAFLQSPKGAEGLPSGAETKTISFPVEGMSCGSCVASVKRAVKALDGVTKVEVSLEERRARVQYVDGKVTPERIERAVRELGYKAGEPVPETAK